jgi:hypothetical protein
MVLLLKTQSFGLSVKQKKNAVTLTTGVLAGAGLVSSRYVNVFDPQLKVNQANRRINYGALH